MGVAMKRKARASQRRPELYERERSLSFYFNKLRAVFISRIAVDCRLDSAEDSSLRLSIRIIWSIASSVVAAHISPPYLDPSSSSQLSRTVRN